MAMVLRIAWTREEGYGGKVSWGKRMTGKLPPILSMSSLINLRTADRLTATNADCTTNRNRNHQPQPYPFPQQAPVTEQ